MKLRNLAAGVVIASAAFGVTAVQASTFLLTFTQVGTPTNGCCGPFDISATLQATADGGNYDITDISGTVTQNGTSYAIGTLIPPPNDPANLLGFDNKIIANSGNAPFTLDNGGIGFYVPGIFNYYPVDPYAAFNIYDNSSPNGGLSATASYDVNTEFNGTYSITAAVPEPSTWAMMLLGFVGLGFMAYRRRNSTQALA